MCETFVSKYPDFIWKSLVEKYSLDLLIDSDFSCLSN